MQEPPPLSTCLITPDKPTGNCHNLSSRYHTPDFPCSRPIMQKRQNFFKCNHNRYPYLVLTGSVDPHNVHSPQANLITKTEKETSQCNHIVATVAQARGPPLCPDAYSSILTQNPVSTKTKQVEPSPFDNADKPIAGSQCPSHYRAS